MEIVSEGSLESISRPSSTASEKGRRSSRKVHNIQTLQPSRSLEILPPEEISGIPSELFSALEGDVEVEEFEDEDVKSDSNDDSEFSLDEEIEEREVVPFASENQHSQDTSRSDTANHQEELNALTDGDVDPQIREGMEKIKKLDKILADKMKREKEVKNHRHQMEKMWKEQLQQMVKSQDGSNGNQSLVGATLLALELGNEEILGSSRDDPVTPVFATQPLGTEEKYTPYQNSATSGSSTRGSSRSSDRYDNLRKERKGKKHRDNRNNSAQDIDNKEDSSKKTHRTKDKHKESGQDFIQRNKKLAADAANIVPMTEEEKKRLEQLLSSDVNEMMENPYDDESLRLREGVGFRPDEESVRALADIDEKLKALVPANELEMLSSRAFTDIPLSERSEAASADSQASSKRTLETLDNVDIGERVLREEKEARDMHQRILDIEVELKNLKEISEDETEETISRAILDKLLGESSRTTSRSTTIAESVVSSLATPHHFAIDQGPIVERDREATPSTLGTVSAFSDVTLTSTDIDTPRTLTSASSFGT